MKKFSNLNTVLAVIIIILLAIIILRGKDNDVKPLPKPVGISVLGRKDDLVSSSVKAGDAVSGKQKFSAVVKGGYFFEANILVNILDANKNILKKGNAQASGEWMTAEPVGFETELDFTGLPKGPGYIEIHNDNPSDMRENDKQILIPIIIK